jgi:hypothetical protein
MIKKNLEKSKKRPVFYTLSRLFSMTVILIVKITAKSQNQNLTQNKKVPKHEFSGDFSHQDFNHFY